MQIEFDAQKDAINLAKHGVSLVFGAAVWADPTLLIIPSLPPIDGEERFKAVGIIANRLWTAVHVHRGAAIRIISVRKSNDGGQRLYDRVEGGPQ